ncbi:hypothetical protein HDV01_001259 [Terramyces sp. JEL0728]|nr:hypothetical protein HDV01_001259 [Terramyces sp. JEL0728]
MTNFFGFLHSKPESNTPAHPTKSNYEETTDFLHKLDLNKQPEPEKEEASPVTIPGGFPENHHEYTLHYTSSPPQSDTLPWKKADDHLTTPFQSKIPTPAHSKPASPVAYESPSWKPPLATVDVSHVPVLKPVAPTKVNPQSSTAQSNLPWLQSAQDRPVSPGIAQDKPPLPNRPVTPKGDKSPRPYYASLDKSAELKPPSPTTNRPPSPHYSIGSNSPRPASPNYASLNYNQRPPSPHYSTSYNDSRLNTPPASTRPYSPTNIKYHQTLPTPPPKDDITTRVESIISRNQLQAFYPPGSYDNLIKRIKSINVQELSKAFGVPEEICKDLFALALYDIVIYADDSGSMKFEDDGQRIETLKTILSRVAQIGTLFDDDGISVRFFNGDQSADNITNARAVDDLIQRTDFVGITPIGTNLEAKILTPMVYETVARQAFKKPLLVFIITDGEPSGEDEDTLIKVVDNCQQFLQKFGLGHGVGIQVSQVGNDHEAQKYLTMLEGNAKDIVATTPNYELLQERYRVQHIHLTFDHWLLQLMLGPIKF